VILPPHLDETYLVPEDVPAAIVGQPRRPVRSRVDSPLYLVIYSGGMLTTDLTRAEHVAAEPRVYDLVSVVGSPESIVRGRGVSSGNVVPRGRIARSVATHQSVTESVTGDHSDHPRHEWGF